MKNGLLIWNAVLTLIAGFLLFKYLDKKKSDNPPGKRTESGALVANAPFRIAYFEMDSMENNLDMVKDVKAEISKKDEEYNNEVSKLDWTYQKKIQDYQQKASSMTQADYDKAQTDLRQLEGKLRNQKQELDQRYQNFVMARNLSVKKKIEDYLADFNKSRNYSYIVSYEQGLFYYKDTAYNITSELIAGLNEEYKKEKEKEKKN